MANHQADCSVYRSPRDSSTDAMAAWQDGVKVSAISSRADQHTIHAYSNTSPESPDGRWVLYFASATSEGHVGDLHIVERGTGQVRILARNVTNEQIKTRSLCSLGFTQLNAQRLIIRRFITAGAR